MLRVAQGYFKLGTWGAGRIESEMGREAQTGQMDTLKAAYNGESPNKIFSRQNSRNGGLGQQGGRDRERMWCRNRLKRLCLSARSIHF